MEPLSFIDAMLLDVNIGQVLLLVFVLALLGALPLKSGKVIALTITVFGLIFMMTPAGIMPDIYLFLGIGLVIVGPMLYVTTR